MKQFTRKLRNLFIVSIPRINNEFLSLIGLPMTPFHNVELKKAVKEESIKNKYVKVMS